MAKNKKQSSEGVAASPKEVLQTERRLSKSEAARRAIAAGVGQPTEASAYIKTHFGLDMTPQHFSAVKSQMKSKLSKVTIQGKPAVEAQGRGVHSRAGQHQETDLMEAMEAMKPLVAALGVEKVKRLADLLA